MEISIKSITENSTETYNTPQQWQSAKFLESFNDETKTISLLQSDLVYLKESMIGVLCQVSKSIKKDQEVKERLKSIQINLELSKKKLGKIKKRSKSISNKIRSIEQKISLCDRVDFSVKTNEFIALAEKGFLFSGSLSQRVKQSFDINISPIKNFLSSSSLSLKIKPWTGRNRTPSTNIGFSYINQLEKIIPKITNKNS